jgi:hypothetical protein
MAMSREKIVLCAWLCILQMHQVWAGIRLTCCSFLADKTLGGLQNSLRPIKISTNCHAAIDLNRPQANFALSGIPRHSTRLFLTAHHRVFGQHSQQIMVLLGTGLSHVALKRRRLRGRDWHGDEKVAGDKIVEQVSQRERTPQLGDRNPSIRFIPFPAGRGRAV